MASHRADDLARDVARVERVRPVDGDPAQREGVGRVPQRRARLHGSWRAALAGGEEQPARLRVLRQIGGGLRNRIRQPGRHGEALFGERDRRGEQRRPRQFAVPVVRSREQGHRARHADRQPADGDVVTLRRRAGVGEEHPLVGGRGRRLAAIEGVDLAAAGVVGEHEAAAAEAGRLRLHKTQHELRGDGGVGRRSALLQDVERGLRGVGVRRHHHRLFRLMAAARRDLGHDDEEGQGGSKVAVTAHDVLPGPAGRPVACLLAGS